MPWLMLLILMAICITVAVYLTAKRAAKRKGGVVLPAQAPRPAYTYATPGQPDVPVFQGLRVVELATVIAGPTTGVLLAAFGAEVIKFEEPGGDKFRGQFHAFEKDGGRQWGTMFENSNFNKASVMVDLKKPGDLKKFYDLLGEADVFVTNIRLASLERIGLDYESVHQQLPSLIYAHVSAWGREGPDRGLPGYDVGAFWASTSIAATLMPEGRHMLYPGGFGDCQTGEDMFAGVCAALLRRMEGGDGQLVDSSLQRFGMWCASPWLVTSVVTSVGANEGANATTAGAAGAAGAMGTSPHWGEGGGMGAVPHLADTWEDSVPRYQPWRPSCALRASYATLDAVHFSLAVPPELEATAGRALASLLALPAPRPAPLPTPLPAPLPAPCLTFPLPAALPAASAEQDRAAQMQRGLQERFGRKNWVDVERLLRDLEVPFVRVQSPMDLMREPCPEFAQRAEMFVRVPGVTDTRGFVNVPFTLHSSSQHGYTRGAPVAGAHTQAFFKEGWSPRPAAAALPPVATSRPASALGGVVVVELLAGAGTGLCVPATGQRLRALGAEVTQVEPAGGSLHRTGKPRVWAQYNQGKRHQAFDWRANLPALQALLAKADVLLTDVPLSALRAAGLNYDSVKAAYPRLVYAIVTPWGLLAGDGPRGDHGAFWVASGMGQYLGGAAPAPPLPMPDHLGDLMVSTSLFAATLAALFHQRRTGQGQLVDVCELRHGAWCMSTMYGVFRKDPDKLRLFMIAPHLLQLSHPLATYNAFRTRDGVYIQLLGLDMARHLPRWLAAAGLQRKAYGGVLGALCCQVLPNMKETNLMLRLTPVFRALNAAFAGHFAQLSWTETKAWCYKNDIWFSKVANRYTAVRNRQAHATHAFGPAPGGGLLVLSPTQLSAHKQD